ncbi:transporter [Neisseria polysaccharea]|uniref:Transporter n=1 Tax=Neisseria polysaccharea TaxID=489 RepID=A0ABV1JJ24_NEIPO
MELWKAIWHTVFDFFSELFDEKPWQEKDTKSKLKILGALLLGAILTFIFYKVEILNIVHSRKNYPD